MEDNHDPIGKLEVNHTPVQDGRGTVLRQYTFGGPESGRDTRMYLHAIELEHLLHIAKSAPTNRVILNRAGLVVTVRRSSSGHVFEEVRIVCDQPVRETIAGEMKMSCTNDEARRFARAYGVKPKKIII